MDRDPEDGLTPSRDEGLAEGDIVEKTVKSCRSAGVPQIEIDWKGRVRPGLEKTFDTDREYVFHQINHLLSGRSFSGKRRGRFQVLP